MALVPTKKTPSHVIDQLTAAVAAGDMNAFQQLLDGPQTHVNELHEVMCEALRHDNAFVVTELLRRCKSMHYWDPEVAIAAHAKQSLVAVIDLGWDVNAPGGHHLPSVLRYAVADREMVFWFLKRGADLNRRAHIDITPLSFAVKNSPPDLLRELLDHGGDVQRGEVLQYALDRKSDVIPVLGMLLDRGAPLDAVMYEEHPGSMQLYFLFERHTPLCKAAAMGNAEAVRFLLDRGADPSVQNSMGWTALECADRKDHRDVVEILIQQSRATKSGRLPKTPLLIEGHAVWVKTENLVGDGTFVMIGDAKWAGLAVPGAPGRSIPAPSGGGSSLNQAQEAVRSEMADDDEAAGPLTENESGGSSPRDINDDGTESERAKEASPAPGSVGRSPGCFGLIARWTGRRRNSRTQDA